VHHRWFKRNTGKKRPVTRDDKTNNNNNNNNGDRNMIKKEAENILKCKDLRVDMQHMWNVKTKVIPVIMGQLEPSHNHSENTSATYRESMGEKTAVLGTAHILRKVLL
jgi:hypothetical protein